MIDLHHGWNPSVKPVILGFVISLILTLAAYLIVVKKELADREIIYIVIAIGTIQVLAQLVFFLHLGLEEKPRWQSLTFLFMLLVVFILVGGSVWIMNNLDYNTMMMNH